MKKGQLVSAKQIDQVAINMLSRLLRSNWAVPVEQSRRTHGEGGKV